MGVSVYLLAIFNRSSLGVAGLLAVDRFGIKATELATFTVLQLLVYAAMQVPVGVLLDRYGARLLLAVGLVLMSIGQLMFAFAHAFGPAVLARGVLGAGDAMVFNSVLRLVAAWFLVRQAPGLAQMTGQTGAAGGLIASLPLTWALHALGWTPTFVIASATGMLLLVFVLVAIRDTPYPRTSTVDVKLRALTRSLAAVWGNPGNRLAMWGHFTTPFSGNLMALLWGFPFLVKGEGLSKGAASSLIGLTVFGGMVSGLVLARLAVRFVYYRAILMLVVVGAIALVWTVVLALPGHAPIWLLVVLMLVISAGGPASVVGFDVARTFTPAHALGRANGVVNIGGFSATILAMAAVGIVLDRLEPRGSAYYGLDDFRIALSVQYVFWAFGVAQILRYRRKALRHLATEHPGAIEALRAGTPWQAGSSTQATPPGD